MKQDSQQRLVEVMSRLDKTFKPKLNEMFGGNTDDPTKEEMVGFLTNSFRGLLDPAETDANNFDMEAAIYWFANGYHGGQSSNLYSVLSTSDFRPGSMQRSIEDLESGTATEMYNALVQKYGGQKQQYVAERTINEQTDKYGLINKAVRGGFLTPDEYFNNEQVFQDAIESVTERWSDSEEIGSSDMTFMLKELLDEVGIKTDFVNGKLTRTGGLQEVFGWSAKEKETKANQQTIAQAKEEIQKYPPSHIFGQPGRNSAPQDDKNLMNVRLNMAKQYMPTLAELMPQLFDLTQGHGDMVQIYHGKPLKGLVPSNWYYFLRGAEGYVDNEQAVRKLNQELDGLGQKMGLGENIHNTAQMGGILNSRGTAGYNPDATNTPKTPDGFSVGHNVYKEVMALINAQTGDEVWGGGAENALKFYDKVIDGIRDAMYQDMGDSVNPNAGAAPDEI